jgi:prepilin-type N-terminal cleavage/methylation domain-containing protein
MGGSFFTGRPGHNDGFTLLETLMVLALIGIMAAVSVPALLGAVAHAKLRSTGSSLAGLMQSARVEALKTNRAVTVHFSTQGGVPFAYVKTANDPSPDTMGGATQVQLGAATFQLAVPSGDTPPLTDAELSYTAHDLPDLVSFSARGLPCSYAAGVCPTAGFVYYITDRTQADAWVAVSVSPGGRVKQWLWNGRAWGN